MYGRLCVLDVYHCLGGNMSQRQILWWQRRLDEGKETRGEYIGAPARYRHDATCRFHMIPHRTHLSLMWNNIYRCIGICVEIGASRGIANHRDSKKLTVNSFDSQTM